MSGAPSGTYGFQPALSEVVLESYERCGMRSAQLTQEHMASARRSMNLVQSRWSNRGINLWKVDLVQVTMPQGQASYPVDLSVINVLDIYLRQWQMGAPVNVVPGFITTLGSPDVVVVQPGGGPGAGSFINIIVPVSVGGQIIQGFYQVLSAQSGGNYTIVAASNATSTQTGGTVPRFNTTALSANVSVNLPNHGYLVGQSFTIQVTVAVGGLNLDGAYTIAGVTDANNFIITAPYVAGSTDQQWENGQYTQIAQQTSINGFTQSSDPTDLLLYPLSRNDYAAVPDKVQQGRPTSVWYDRTLSPSLTVWPVPDGNGPYQLCYYVFRQIEDASATGGQTGDMPQRFFEAYVAAVAANLAVKWAPTRAMELFQYSELVWTEAASEDREKVSSYVTPDFSGYFR